MPATMIAVDPQDLKAVLEHLQRVEAKKPDVWLDGLDPPNPRPGAWKLTKGERYDKI